MTLTAPKNTGRVRFITNRRCPFAQKVWIALEEYYYSSSGGKGGNNKGYDLVEVGLYGGSGKPRWFMDINPKGQVPVLWLPSERVIVESDAILDYLVTLPPPPRRKGGAAAATAGGNEEANCNSLAPPRPEQHSKWQALMPPFLNSAKQAVMRDDTSTLANLLYKLDGAMPAPSPFLSGPSFSATDAAFLPFYQRIADNYPDVARESSPRLWEWYEQHACERPSVQATRVTGGWWWW